MPGGFSFIGNFKIDEDTGHLVSRSVGSSALLATAADATTIEVSSSTGKLGLVDQGTSAANGVARANMSKGAGFWLQGSVVGSSTAAGGAIKVENTFSSNLVVDRAIIYVATAEASAGTCTIDVGTDGAGTSSDDSLLDGANMKTAGATDNIRSMHAGDSGKSVVEWKSGEFLVGTISATTTEMVAYYGFHVVDLTA
jgi:hypothetical protein